MYNPSSASIKTSPEAIVLPRQFKITDIASAKGSEFSEDQNWHAVEKEEEYDETGAEAIGIGKEVDFDWHSFNSQLRRNSDVATTL